MKRYIVIFGTLIVLLCISVVLWPHAGRHQEIQRRLESSVAAGASSFDFAAGTSFAWDRMFVFGPYSTQAEVDKALGFGWPGFRHTTIRSSDSVCLVVFVQGNKVVGWYEQPRTIELAWLANGQGYRRSEAKFAIDRSGGRPSLRAAARSGGATTRSTQ